MLSSKWGTDDGQVDRIPSVKALPISNPPGDNEILYGYVEDIADPTGSIDLIKAIFMQDQFDKVHFLNKVRFDNDPFPDVDDDETEGYFPCNMLINVTRGKIFQNIVNDTAAAVWKEILHHEDWGLFDQNVKGMKSTFVDATSITIGTSGEVSAAANSTSKHIINFLGTKTLDLSVLGVGGRDAGAEAADTWYAVYVIWAEDESAVAPALVASTNFTTPTLPAGYDTFRRVHAIYNNSSSNIRPYIQVGDGKNRWTFWDDEKSELQALNGGGAIVYTDIDLSSFMPPSSEHVEIVSSFDTQNASDLLEFRPDGSTVSAALRHQIVAVSTTGANQQTQHFDIPAPGQIIEYRITGGGAADADVHVVAFFEEL